MSPWASHLKVLLQSFFYVMGKALLDELSFMHGCHTLKFYTKVFM